MAETNERPTRMPPDSAASDPDKDKTNRANGGSKDGIVSVSILSVVLVAVLVALFYGNISSLFRNSNETVLAGASPLAAQEWVSARADHDAVALSVAACSGISKAGALSREAIVQLRLDTLPNTYRQWKPSDASETAQGQLTNFGRAAVYLSDAIGRERFITAELKSDNHDRMVRFQIAIVVIGGLTTLLISLKSISNLKERLSFWLGVFAIIFSAIGTATAALNSFYAPREAHAASERSLVALRQLHSELAAAFLTEVQETACPTITGKPDDQYAKQIHQWSVKLSSILTSSQTPSPKQDDAHAAPPKAIDTGTTAASAGGTTPEAHQ